MGHKICWQAKAAIYTIIAFIIMMFCTCPYVYGGQVSLGSVDLPAIVSGDHDTVTFTSDGISSATNGIRVTGDSVVIMSNTPGTKDTLYFDTDGDGNRYGILGDPNILHLKILDIAILHDCDNADTSYDNRCLEVKASIDWYIENCYFYAKSWDSRCVYKGSGAGFFYNAYFKKCTFKSDCSTYTSRGVYDGAIAYINIRNWLGPDSFHVVWDTCTVEAGFHAGICMVGALGLKKTVTDATNGVPIQITTSVAHSYSTGNVVYVEHIEGNVAANGIWTVTVVDADEFTLDGSTGSGIYSSGGTSVRDYRAKAKIFGCSFTTDDRNFLYEWDSCGAPGDACATYKSSANGYDVLFWKGGPSLIYDNTFTPADVYGGSRAILLDNMLGREGDTTLVYDNVITGHEGPYGEAIGAYGSATMVRIRSVDGTNACGFIKFYDNSVTVSGDSSLATPSDASPAFGYRNQCLFISIRSYDSGHIYIENNTFTQISLTDSTKSSCLYIGPFAGTDKDIIFRNNKYTFDDVGIRLGAGSMCSGFSSEGDTFALQGGSPEHDSASILIGGSSGVGDSITNNTIKDPTHLGSLPKDMVRFGTIGTNDGEIYFQKTCSITVTRSGAPVEAVTVKAITDYNDTTIVGTTDPSGITDSALSYIYVKEDAGDSTFWPYEFLVYKAADSATDTLHVNSTNGNITIALGGSGRITKIRGWK